MPTVNDPNQQQSEDDQKKQQQDQTQLVGGPIATGSQGSAGTPSAQKPSSSGQFTNIQNYLNANQNNNLGQQVENKFSDIKQQGSNQLDQANKQFQTDAEKTGQAIANNKQNIQDAGNAVTGTDTDYNNAYQNLQKGANYQYQGPQGLGNTVNLESQAQSLGQLGNLTGTDSGRYTLLQKFFGNPQYTSGQTKLDNLLLGAQGNNLAGTRQIASSLGTDVQQSEQNANAQVSGLQGQAGDVRNQALQTAGQSAGNIKSQLGQGLTNFVNQETQLQANPNVGANQLSLTTPVDVGNGQSRQFTSQLTPEQAKQLGLLTYNGPNADLTALRDPSKQSDFLGRVNPNLGSRYNALSALSGSSDTVGTGDQLQHGNYSVNNGAANTDWANAVQSVLAQNRGAGAGGQADMTNQQALNQAINGNSYNVGDWNLKQSASSQASQNKLSDQIQRQALSNLLAKYNQAPTPATNAGLMGRSQSRAI